MKCELCGHELETFWRSCPKCDELVIVTEYSRPFINWKLGKVGLNIKTLPGKFGGWLAKIGVRKIKKMLGINNGT